jgi:hypothetical protein
VPPVKGTPAIDTLSLTATVLPANLESIGSFDVIVV